MNVVKLPPKPLTINPRYDMKQTDIVLILTIFADPAKTKTKLNFKYTTHQKLKQTLYIIT